MEKKHHEILKNVKEQFERVIDEEKTLFTKQLDNVSLQNLANSKLLDKIDIEFSAKDYKKFLEEQAKEEALEKDGKAGNEAKLEVKKDKSKRLINVTKLLVKNWPFQLET